ncbi:uncharacterized protein LOC135688651, partial [Rhopilema esculentum]|uniref:uncharacterized protein LOC135688651 n=1 Tax=Rhopilema esculentum TaxID=499914 RepID=UPI0031DF09FD
MNAKAPGVSIKTDLMKTSDSPNNNRVEGNTKTRSNNTRFHGNRRTARRTLWIEDGRADDSRSGQPSSIETRQKELRSTRIQQTQVYKEQRRQEELLWIETDVLPIKGAGKPRLLRRRQKELRSKDPANQVSRNRDGKKDFVDRDGRAVDQRSGQPSSIETETERASLKGSSKPGFKEQRRIQQTRVQGTETARRTLWIETDVLSIKGAGNPRLLRRRQKELRSKDPATQVSRNRDGKKDFENRDGRAADQRSGGHWSPETGETEVAGLKGKRRTCCRSKERGILVSRDGRDGRDGRSRSQGKETDMLLIKGAGTLVSRDGRDGRSRSQGKETDMLSIKGAGDTGLQRRERRKKHVSRERDEHAADQRSGGHWSPETGETGEDGRSRSQGKETDMLLIKGAGDTGLQRRERRKKQVSRERDGHAVDQRSGGHWSPETGETEEAGLKGKRVSSSLSLETVTKRPSIQGSNRPSFNEQRLIGLKRNCQTARSQGKQSGRIAERISGKAKKEPDAIVSMPSHGHVGCLSIR